MKSAREIAADILCEVDGGAMSHGALNEALRRNQLQPPDKDLVKLLVSGTLEHLTEIDGIIDTYSRKKAAGLKPIVRNVLRISIYQIKYLGNIPQSAVCNEAVKIIDHRRIMGLKGFVNAVLRAYSDTIPQEDGRRRQEPKGHSELPPYIRDILIRRVGQEDLDRVICALDRPSPLTCRFNLSRAGEQEILASLEGQHITAEQVIAGVNGYMLTETPAVNEIEAFRAGLIQIQGLSSILACQALSPAAGSRVLDICGAPGGKTIALADMTGPEGQVVSRDLTEKKVRMIDKNLERCGFKHVITEVRDACTCYEEDREAYDYVMADLPCSGLGTIGHKQEIRYRVTPEKVAELALLQRQILTNAASYVKPGGCLLYSTCTISYEENEDNYAYIRDELGLTPVPLMGEAFRGHDSAAAGFLQLLPGPDPVSDGFFISLFRREK